jgi:hypothetical protein
MDSSAFRSLKSDSSAANFRNCISHWWAAMRASGLGDDPEQQAHLVTAICYGLVCRDKSLQHVYRDAFLDPMRTKHTEAALPDATRERIRRIVQGRDRVRVQQELDAVLGRFEPHAKVLPALQEAFRHWVGNGVVAFRQKGMDGLEQFLPEIDSWLAKYRKKGGHIWVRQFVNLFAYEAKVSFYRCFANTWVDLIPWLVKHRGLSGLSARFLGFWHNQNQPLEIPPGRTVGGLYRPTHVQATLIEPVVGDRRAVHRIIFTTGQIGPTHLRDSFNGMVLSLHPISGIFMRDPALCAVAGEFFTSESYERVMSSSRADTCPEYWDLIGAILTAAHLYRLVADDLAKSRGIRHRGGEAVQALSTSHVVDVTDTALLEDFAAYRRVVCPDCHGPARLERYHPADSAAQTFAVDYRCRTCSRSILCTFARTDFEAWLTADDD